MTDERHGGRHPVDRGRAALVVAHPGHELMVHHWLERRRPLYLCLTDGSGGAAASRVPSTARLLRKVGATPGPIFGRYADRQVYQLLLAGRAGVLVALARELADALAAADVDCVAGDAAEGFNPAHDVCRFLIDAAVARVRRKTGRTLHNYEIALDSRPDDCPEPQRAGALWLRLDDGAVRRKLTAARAYPELRGEVLRAARRFGEGAFAVECLRPAASASLALGRFEDEAPAYERHGRSRVAQGVYHEVIRYRHHVRPVLAALRAEQEEEGGGA
jgi:hypothetical protein